MGLFDNEKIKVLEQRINQLEDEIKHLNSEISTLKEFLIKDNTKEPIQKSSLENVGNLGSNILTGVLVSQAVIGINEALADTDVNNIDLNDIVILDSDSPFNDSLDFDTGSNDFDTGGDFGD